VKSICYSSCSLNVLLHFFYCGWKCVQLIIQLLIPNCYYFRWLICLTFTVKPSITCWTSKNWLISHPILHNAFTHMTQHSAASTCSNQSLSQSKWKSHHFLFLLWLSIYSLSHAGSIIEQTYDNDLTAFPSLNSAINELGKIDEIGDTFCDHWCMIQFD